MMSDNSDILEPASKKQRLNIEDNTDENTTNEDNNIETNVYDKDSEYNSFVTPEEVEKLKEFKVLDEVKSNDEDSNNEDSDSDGESEGLPEEEIEKMLEEDLPEGFKGAPKPKEKPYVTKQKIVLEEKGVNHFEVLPLDWIAVRHFSGIPIYMHRATRVCTLSKPYFLGKGNTRRHDIPISAIPCLAYRRALEEEEKQKEIDKKIDEQIKNGTWQQNTNKTSTDTKQTETTNTENTADNNTVENNNETCGNTEDDKKDSTSTENTTESNIDSIQTEKTNSPSLDPSKCPFMNGEITEEKKAEASETQEEVPLSRQPVVLPGGIVMAPPRVESVNTSWKTQHLTAEQVNDYCKSLFKFKTINIMHFMCWAERRKYTKARRALQYPALPPGTKLVTIPQQGGAAQDNGGKAVKRDWVMNMNGRSYLSEFHEYVHRALHKQPVYEFKQLENAQTPYQATVYIGGMQYGVGHGSSKRQAKSAAARASIQILIPEMREDRQADTQDTNNSEPDFSFFDYVGIEDPRITEFCAATCEPSPHAILRTCLLRNFGAGERHIHTEMKKEFQKISLTMRVGKHSASVVCKNKKTAKQRAAQALLQALHPQLRAWGSLLRLYGSRSLQSGQQRRREEQQVTLLQDKARPYEPNYAVLDKLRLEMRRLQQRDAAVVPIGTLLLRDQLPHHSGSNLDNVDL